MLDSKTETGFTMSNLSYLGEENSIEPRLSMPALAQGIKETTFQARLDISESDILIMNWLKTLEVDSTSNGKDLTEFWTESFLEMSKKLLSLTKIDCAGLDFLSSNLLQQKTTAESWFSKTHNSPIKKNLLQTLFPSSTFSPVGFTDSGNTVIRSKKIRIYPQAGEILKFKKYCGLTRYWFNKAVEYLKQPETKASIMEVRKIQKNEHPGWAFGCPQRIREHAMSDACVAVKNAKMKAKKTKTFNEVHYRRKKDSSQRFGFDSNSLKSGSVFRGENSVKFFATEGINVEKEGTEITLENGRWFVIVPTIRNIKKPDNQRLGIVALDPGVRTFQTYFSPFVFGKIGEGDFNRVYRLCKGLDDIYSKISKADYNTKRRLKKARKRLSWKIKDLISDVHKKTAYFLVTNFDTVLIPYFETSKMVTKLHSKTARSMLTWAHYRFKSFLMAKAEEYSCNVIEVNEAYTSKTCSMCGKVQNIGSKKVMKCGCGNVMDRDLNGARNIFLKSVC